MGRSLGLQTRESEISNDSLKRTQSALAKMQGRNQAGSSGRWCHCDTARLHFFRNKALQLIQRGQLDLMSKHWPMLEGPKIVTGEAKAAFEAWATQHYTRPRDGAVAVTEDPAELKRLLDEALLGAHVHAKAKIPHGRPPSQRAEFKITMNFSGGRYLGKMLEEARNVDFEGASFLRWLAGYGNSAFTWHTSVEYTLLAQSFERLVRRVVVFRTSDISTWVAQWKDGIKPPSTSPALPMAPSDRNGERGRDEDSEDEEEQEDDEGAGGGELGSRGLVHSYKMNHVQRRGFNKMRN